jgi:hypothetical protein
MPPMVKVTSDSQPLEPGLQVTGSLRTSLGESSEIEMAILVIRNSRKEMHNATRTPQQTHSSPEL